MRGETQILIRIHYFRILNNNYIVSLTVLCDTQNINFGVDGRAIRLRLVPGSIYEIEPDTQACFICTLAQVEIYDSAKSAKQLNNHSDLVRAITSLFTTTPPGPARDVVPMRSRSICLAACLPSAMAVTTKD